jgi:drug/metabolite transporter (DMT)-like permease
MTKRTVSVLSGAGLLCAACIWGFAFVVVKDSLDYVGAIYMLAFRFTIAVVALSLLFLVRFKKLTKKDWKDGVILGVFLFAAYAFQTVGCGYTTAGKNAFLTTIYVILVPLFGWPLSKKRPAWYVFAAAVMSVTGIGLLALTSGQGILLTMNIGDVLTLICGIFYALHILYMEKSDRRGDPILLTILQFLFAALFSWSFAPFMDGAFPLQAVKNPHVIISMLYLGLLSTMVCFVLQNVGLKYVQSSIASLFLSFESVFGVLFSALILHEHLTPRMAAGCVLIFLAVILAETKFNFCRKKIKKDFVEVTNEQKF